MSFTLKGARNNIDMTQEELAKKMNVSKNTIISWEKGKTMPNVKLIPKLCRILGVGYNDIRWHSG